MTVDHERAQVYAAEEMAYGGTTLEELISFDAVASCIAAVIADPWWPGGSVQVERARRDARSSSARSCHSGVARIRLAAGQLTLATGIHELGHVLASAGGGAGVRAGAGAGGETAVEPDPGHGPRFRRAHIDIAAVAFGVERAGWLLDAYQRAGLSIGDRSWPEPPVWASGGAIAL